LKAVVGADASVCREALIAFRSGLYRCFTRRGDALFDLVDAVLTAQGPVESLVELSQEKAFRRGHGALYDALADGDVDVARLAGLIASSWEPADEGPVKVAVDVSAWPRPDAVTSPGLCHCYTACRCDGARKTPEGARRLVPHPVRTSARTRRDPSQALRMRILATMWLPGNRPRADARQGIESLYYAVTAALQTNELDGPPTLADASFDYEWERLLRDRPREERQLVTLLSFLAPAPLPLSTLASGWEALPSPLRRVVTDPTSLASLVTGLSERGLLAVDRDTVTCSAETQQQVHARLNGRSQRTACAFALRFLRAALPLNTHHHGSWKTWKPALPHVSATTAHADRLTVRLFDAARLLDRKAVYHMDADLDAEAAIEDALSAIALSDRAGQPDAEYHAIYLANHAMALRQAGRLDAAIDVMDQSLQFHRERIGVDDEEYASSLSIKAAMLSSRGQHNEAEQTHRQALASIRAVLARRPEPYVGGKLVEILNDYATHLLRHAAQFPAADDAAVALLDEALDHIRRGDYGWQQVTTNRAKAARKRGNLHEAETILRDLVQYCEQEIGDPSYELFAALADLADVLKERGSPDYEAIYLRAHEVDDAIGPDAATDDDDPTS
jgi:tetratricopeptide (TPR) repeat protein